MQNETVYLNHAATGPLPTSTVRTLHEWAAVRSKPWLVGDHDTVFPALARTRRLCATLIGARSSEIALVPNTSFGLSMAARSLPLSAGDIVLVPDGEFPSIVYAWRAVEQSRGIKLDFVSRRNGLLDEEAILNALDRPRVRAVALSWVSFATGYRADLVGLGRACRQRGIFLVVDAMQGLGPATLDVNTCGADVVACGGYKWLLSPWGTAFVYVREDLITRLEPPVVSWFVGPASEDYSRLLDYDFRYFSDARRFEVMTLATQDFVAMGTSLDLLLRLGSRAIEIHVRELVDRIVEWALERSDCQLLTPIAPSRRAGIAAIVVSDPRATSDRLRTAKIAHSVREGAIRLSPYLCNTLDDVNRALKIIGGEQ